MLKLKDGIRKRVIYYGPTHRVCSGQLFSIFLSSVKITLLPYCRAKDSILEPFLHFFIFACESYTHFLG